MGDAKAPSTSRYRLLRCIASGGMGAVYVGVQRGAAGFERPVAIKRAHKHLLTDASARQAILEEALHASAVRHPNVVSIDDVEEVDGELLLVMDFVQGGSLAQLLGSGKKMPVGVALRIVLDACHGLDAIHSATGGKGEPLGLVHRDISPQNLLVGADGVTRITDFGIAKRAGDPKRTAKTTRRGKYGYMSPEYLRTGETSQSSDLFALGIVLWESLACRRLFRGESNVETIRLMSAADVPSLVEVDSAITVAIDACVKTALARSTDDRFPSVLEMARALEVVSRDLIASHAEVAAFVAATVAPVPTEATEDLASADLVDIAEEDKSGTRTIAGALPAFSLTPVLASPEAAAAALPLVDIARPIYVPLHEGGRVHRAFSLEARLGEIPKAPALPKIKMPNVAPKPRVSQRAALSIFVAALLTMAITIAWAGLAEHDAAPAPSVAAR